MKIIEPSVELWEQGYTLPEIWEHIARCARVCYQTEKKNDDESDEMFCRRVLMRHMPANHPGNHLSVLEHGTVYLKVPVRGYEYDKHIYKEFVHNPFTSVSKGKRWWYITTNMRVIVENGLEAYLDCICVPNKYHFRRTTISTNTNIGVSREFNRHRVHSISEESTRYCNYSNDRFGKALTFIKPAWIDKIPYKEDKNPSITNQIWCDVLIGVENSYIALLEAGWTPQQAREVLPLATKTQTVHTAFDIDWKKFIRLRADEISGPVHPNMKVIADKIKEIINGTEN